MKNLLNKVRTYPWFKDPSVKDQVLVNVVYGKEENEKLTFRASHTKFFFRYQVATFHLSWRCTFVKILN